MLERFNFLGEGDKHTTLHWQIMFYVQQLYLYV